jgi:hypothetical protein
MVIFIFRLDWENISWGQYFDYLAIAVPMVFTFFGIKDSSRVPGYSYWDGLKTGLSINFISFLIYTPFLLVYHHLINPDWLKYLLAFEETELIAKNVPEETRQEMID